MKHAWLPYVVVIMITAAAGAAIAGLPGNATAVAPATTLAPQPTVTATTVPPATTAPPATDHPAATTTEGTATTTTTTIPELPDRSELSVVVANGSGAPGIAGETADILELNVALVDYADGFERSASRLAAIGPIVGAPAVAGGLSGVDLLAYLGTGQV